MLNGTVSSSIASLKLLALLGLSFNMLTGTIPAFMNDLTGLIYYYFDSNMLTGTLTQSFESLSQIRYLYLSDNTFTGSFPSSGLQYLTNLTDFEVNGNLFIGTLPNTIALLPLLQIIFFQDNLFTGPITNIFNGSTQLFLSNIQLSNNQLTGNLPEQLFRHLPSLEAFSAVSNCFHGRIPSSICQSTSLISLALDGLTCASSCQKKIFPSTISSSYQSSFSIDHGIPLCLFQMPLLQTLHLSGNGLTGSFPSDLEISPSLKDLSLSHNSLTGSIPDSIQKRYWSELDLSFNRIDGVISHNFNKADQNAKLRLENNRLSGPIPNSSIRNMTNFSILQGNLFSCRIDRSDLPRNDPYANSYECASNSFDIVYFIWLANITIAIVLVGVVLMSMYYYSYWRRRGLIVRDRSIQLVTMLVDLIINWKYVRLIISDTHSGWNKLNKLMTINSIMRRFTTNVTLFIVIVLLPIYTVLNYYYHTHEYEYTWTVSCGYIAGRVAFVVLIVTFVLFLVLQISMLMFYLHEHRDVLADNIDSDDLVQILIDSNSSRVSMIPPSITDHTRRQEALSSAMKLKDDAVTADASTNRTNKSPTGDNGDGDSDSQQCNPSQHISVGAGKDDDRNDDSESQPSQYSSITRQSQRDDKDNLFTTRQSFSILRDLFAVPKIKRATNWMIYFVYISSNFIIVSGVNVAYVYATLYHSNSIIVIAQILLSLFKLLWNTIISPGMVMYLVYFVSDDDYNRLITMRGMFQLQFVLSLCNNIVIPFLVVLVISPNCFYSAFGKVNTVDSSFHYNYCLFINPVNDICAAYTLKKATTSYDAPFVYNYQCSSSIIESYAAVFMYMCIVTTFIYPLMRVILYYLHQKWLSITAVLDSNSGASDNTKLHSTSASADSKDNSNDYSTNRSTTLTTYPQWVIMRRSVIDLFFYLTIPKLQLPLTAAGDPKREPLDPFININHVFVMDMTFLAILLSFGTVFPPLAAAVCIAVITRNYIRELIIASFHNTAMKLHKSAFVTILESECASIPPLVIFKSCGWWVMMVSCCFYSLFLFDMLGDEMGALESYWVLIVMPLLPCVLYVSMKAYKYVRDHFVMVVHRDDNGAEDEEMKRYNNHPSLPQPPPISSSSSNSMDDLNSSLDKNIELMEPQVYSPFEHSN
jgi:Leucine-rich repeat (LRR) protein